jgi:hypothetical protein
MKPGPKPSLSPEDIDFAMEKIAERWTTRQIGEHFGLDHSVIWRALSNNPSTYARAKELRAQQHAEAIEHERNEFLRVVKDVEEGRLDPDVGKVVLDGKHKAIATSQWLASRLDGRAWGDKQQIEQTVNVVQISTTSDLQVQLAALEAQTGMLARLGLAPTTAAAERDAGRVLDHVPDGTLPTTDRPVSDNADDWSMD